MLSAAEILAGDPVPPPPDTRSLQTTSQSAAVNATFAEFSADGLTPYGDNIVSRFNDYIARMSRVVDFTGHSSNQPVPARVGVSFGYSMNNEADVRAFTSAMMVDAVRPVILEMLPEPASRDFDWVIMIERPIRGGPLAGHRAIPDMSFCRRYGSGTGTTDIPDVLIEFRGSSVVWGARGSVHPTHDQSDNWIRMTRQLRKYAIYSGCQRLVLMDERCAFFFFLPKPGDETREIEYIAALAPAANTATPVEQTTSAMATLAIAQPADSGSTSPTSTAIDTPPSQIVQTQEWTIRRLLVFAAWHAHELHRPYPPLSDPATIRQPSYTPVFDDDPKGTTTRSGRPTRSHKISAEFSVPNQPAAHIDLQDVVDLSFKRVTRIDARCSGASFEEVIIDGVYTNRDTCRDVKGCIQCILDSGNDCGDPVPSDARSCSSSGSDSGSSGGSSGGSGGSNDSGSGINPSRNNTNAADARTLSLTISPPNILSTHTAITARYLYTLKENRLIVGELKVQSDDGSEARLPCVIKRFPVENQAYLINELRAYSALLHLQKDILPVCFGVFTYCHAGYEDELFLLLELVDIPSVDNSSLSALEKRELAVGAAAALQKVHECGVLHGDLVERNVLAQICEDRPVVLADWEASQFKGEGRYEDCVKWERGVETERGLMRWVFGVQR